MTGVQTCALPISGAIELTTIGENIGTESVPVPEVWLSLAVALKATGDGVVEVPACVTGTLIVSDDPPLIGEASSHATAVLVEAVHTHPAPVTVPMTKPLGMVMATCVAPTVSDCPVLATVSVNVPVPPRRKPAAGAWAMLTERLAGVR